MILDGFIFYNELDLLEMRLEELYPVVDKFILVQADKTFRGTPKPFYFDPEDQRWALYVDKILSIDLEMEDLPGTWEREAYQRNILGEVMRDGSYYSPDDIFIISDVDEIPKRETVASFHDPGEVESIRGFPARLDMKLYYYALNARAAGWGAARILLADDLTTAEEIRHSDPTTIIKDAGWHFSYLGDDEFISNKLKSFSHAELDTPEVHDRVAVNRARLLDPFNHGEELVLEEIDETWPEAVKNNPEYWSKHIWQR